MNILTTAVDALATSAVSMSDIDMDQPYAWGPHDEGVRMALLGSTQELRDLAVRVTAQRQADGNPRTQAQHLLAQNIAAAYDLKALLLDVSAEMIDQPPAPAEWPLRIIFRHLLSTERNFFALVDYGIRRQRSAEALPTTLPDGEADRLLGPRSDMVAAVDAGDMAAIWALFDALQQRQRDTFVDISDVELEGLSVWWEEIEYDLHHRLHRFDAHLRQHTAQVEKALDAIGQPMTEARRLVRNLYNALAEVEGWQLGANDAISAEIATVAQQIETRSAEIATLVAAARALEAAVIAGNVGEVGRILTAQPSLINATDKQHLPLLMTAVYHQQPAVAAALRDAGAEVSIFEAAALGDLAVVQEEGTEYPEDINALGRDGFTPLQLACYFGHEPVVAWLIENDAEISAVAQNPTRIQPIHAAAANGNLAIVQALADAGADLNATQQNDATPLHAAANAGNRALAEWLLAHGADPTAQTTDGQTAADIATTQAHTDLAALLQPVA